MSERIQTIQQFANSSVVFVAGRDGKLQAWKFPKAWRDEQIEKKESEFLVKRKTIARLNASSLSNKSVSKEETKDHLSQSKKTPSKKEETPFDIQPFTADVFDPTYMMH